MAAPKPKPGVSQDMTALRERLSAARAEIEAALSEAAQAAEAIIGRAEDLLSIAKEPRVGEAGLRILEACSFQDLTGQRLKKALSSLERILLEIERKEFGLGPLEDDPARAKWREQNLVHGPAAQGEALAQSAVDRIFEATDKAKR